VFTSFVLVALVFLERYVLEQRPPGTRPAILRRLDIQLSAENIVATNVQLLATAATLVVALALVERRGSDRNADTSMFHFFSVGIIAVMGCGVLATSLGLFLIVSGSVAYVDIAVSLIVGVTIFLLAIGVSGWRQDLGTWDRSVRHDTERGRRYLKHTSAADGLRGPYVAAGAYRSLVAWVIAPGIACSIALAAVLTSANLSTPRATLIVCLRTLALFVTLHAVECGTLVMYYRARYAHSAKLTAYLNAAFGVLLLIAMLLTHLIQVVELWSLRIVALQEFVLVWIACAVVPSVAYLRGLVSPGAGLRSARVVAAAHTSKQLDRRAQGGSPNSRGVVGLLFGPGPTSS
jgi:hypothetical protein